MPLEVPMITPSKYIFLAADVETQALSARSGLEALAKPSFDFTVPEYGVPAIESGIQSKTHPRFE